MAPLPGELLEQPVQLEGCAGATVIEWRATPGFEAETSRSAKAVAVMEETCALVLKEFPAFAQAKSLKAAPITMLDIELCLMPADIRHHGAAARNLNDLKHRFAHRSDRHLLWGFHAREQKQIYLRNDVLQKHGAANPDFVVTLAHELFHAMSWESGAFQGTERDEALAKTFTRDHLRIGE